MIRIAVVPSAPFFEDHFSKIGVTAEEVAEGTYRGTWITQYAQTLASIGVRLVLVCPTRRRPKLIRGALLDVKLIAVPRRNRIPQKLCRSFFRDIVRYIATTSLRLSDFHDCDAIYVQEYASLRLAAIQKLTRSAGSHIVAGHHGADIGLASPLVKWNLRKTRGVVFTTLTKSEATELARVVKEGRNRVAVLPNPVDPEFLAVGEFPVDDTVVMVGRLENGAKRIDRALDLIEFAERVGKPLTLLIVGDGSYRTELEHRVAESPTLRIRVTIVGRVDSIADIADILGSAKAIINTSAVEGFPITVVEGLMAGRYAVVSNLPYVQSELEHTSGVLGISDWTDPQQQMRAIDFVRECAALNDKGRQDVKRRFSESSFRDSFLSTFAVSGR